MTVQNIPASDNQEWKMPVILRERFHRTAVTTLYQVSGISTVVHALCATIYQDKGKMGMGYYAGRRQSTQCSFSLLSS